MSKRTKRGLAAAFCMAGIVAAGIALRLRAGGGQDAPQEPGAPAPVPKLFAMTYKEGHELAGFSGRPMVLVFGNTSEASWAEFLLACEADPRLTELLSSKFQGVFINVAAEAEVPESYRGVRPGTLFVKDLRGPIFGTLEGEYTCADLLRALEEAQSHLSIQKSPAYLRLEGGTDLLDELAGKADEMTALGDREGAAALRREAESMLRLLAHFEPGTPILQRAEARATALGVGLPSQE